MWARSLSDLLGAVVLCFRTPSSKPTHLNINSNEQSCLPLHSMNVTLRRHMALVFPRRRRGQSMFRGQHPQSSFTAGLHLDNMICSPSRNDEETPLFACCASHSHGHYGTCSREGTQSPRAIPIKEIVVTCVLVVAVPFVVLCFLSLRLAHVSTEYNSERSAFARERLLFEHERREWDRERQEWERERIAHMPFWGEMQRVSPYCLAYNTMEYKARLWNVPLGGDWLQACMGTAHKIHNRTVERPARCEDRVSSVVESRASDPAF